MLSDDRFLCPDVEEQSAVRQHPEAGAGRCCACYPKGVFGENQGGCWEESTVTAVNSGQVSVQEAGEVSQRATFSHIPTLASLSFVLLPIHPCSKHRCWPRRARAPEADLLLVALV